MGRFIDRELRSVGPGTHDIKKPLMPPDPGKGPVVSRVSVSVRPAFSLLCAVLFSMVR